MKIILLIFALAILLSNLKGYKNLFKSQKNSQKELDKLLNEESERIGGKENAKAFAFILICIMSIVLIVWHITVGVIVGQPLVILWAALMILLTIRGFFKAVKSITKEKASRRSVLSKLFVPVNTIYICYFIYFIMFTM